MNQKYTLWAGWVYVLDVFALRQKPKFLKIRLTFGKVWILDIFVRVTLRSKITKKPKNIMFSVKVLQKGVIKVLRPIWLSETRGGFLGRQMLLTPPLTVKAEKT